MAENPGDDLSARIENTEAMVCNVASVASIPWEELPDGPARGCLLEMAYAGGDVGAFRTASGCWWIRLGHQTETCAEWAARFSA